MKRKYRPPLLLDIFGRSLEISKVNPSTPVAVVTPLVIESCPKSKVCGKIIERPTGLPVAKAKVSIIYGNKKVNEVLTDIDGHFNFSNLALGNYTLLVTKRGYIQIEKSIIIKTHGAFHILALQPYVH